MTKETVAVNFVENQLFARFLYRPTLRFVKMLTIT